MTDRETSLLEIDKSDFQLTLIFNNKVSLSNAGRRRGLTGEDA